MGFYKRGFTVVTLKIIQCEYYNKEIPILAFFGSDSYDQDFRISCGIKIEGFWIRVTSCF